VNGYIFFQILKRSAHPHVLIIGEDVASHAIFEEA
jgi:hypothetical protein